jgi:hypothetical protein
VLLAVRQRLDVPRFAHHVAACGVSHVVGDPFALDRLVVDVKHAPPHLDAVARQPDDPLDVVGAVVGRQLEDHDVAAFRRGEEYAARNQRQAEWQ